MRLLTALALALSAAACAPRYVETVAMSDDDLPVRSATFAERPVPLSDAFEASCTAPGDVYTQVTREITQCRIVPDPSLAAFLLLEYDGALVAPALVMEKRVAKDPAGYLVEMSYYAEVTQKSGKPRRIYYRQPRLDRMVDAMLEAAGGEPKG